MSQPQHCPPSTATDGSFGRFEGQTSGNLALSLPGGSPLTPVEQSQRIRDTMITEAAAISNAATNAAAAAAQAAQRIAACEGCVVITGVGKAGLIGQKIVATLASTGTPSHFLHPSEAIHGDLGRVRKNDLVMALSNSGRSEEILRVAPILRGQSTGLIALTANDQNPLSNMADWVVPIGRHPEACPLGLAPTTSTAVMLAVGDAIAMLASQLRGFSEDDFGRCHPGGSLGRRLAYVDDVMRPLDYCRVAPQSVSIRDAISQGGSGRRCGAVMLVDANNRLCGLFTDSDLAKLLQQRREMTLDDPVADSMTQHPKTILGGERLTSAIELLNQGKYSELPVVDDDGCPIGMIDVTDLISAGDIEQQETPSPTQNDGNHSMDEPEVVSVPFPRN
ncbi:MAG: KpsF/GutQ family sugar-phosphate isomerase [Planctomycetota bacterium]